MSDWISIKDWMPEQCELDEDLQESEKVLVKHSDGQVYIASFLTTHTDNRHSFIDPPGNYWVYGICDGDDSHCVDVYETIPVEYSKIIAWKPLSEVESND